MFRGEEANSHAQIRKWLRPRAEPARQFSEHGQQVGHEPKNPRVYAPSLSSSMHSWIIDFEKARTGSAMKVTSVS
jgi:hypothetical protein